jgi:hypothetical protein
MQVPVSDSLSVRLAATPLAAENVNAAAVDTLGTEKIITSRPRTCAVILTPVVCPAAHTLTVTVQGRNTAAGAWEDLAVFTAISNGATGVQRKEVAQKNRYRIKRTSTGAFGANVFVTYTAVLVGTDVTHAPIVQVD